MLSIDESKGKEKKVNVNIYVRAKDLKDALKNTEEFMGQSQADYTISSISETAIMDVFEYQKKD